MSAKLCKYACGQTLTWDNSNSRFVEADGTPHTKDRCESLKKKPDAPSNSENHKDNTYSEMHAENMVANRLLVAAINRLAAAIEGKRV